MGDEDDHWCYLHPKEGQVGVCPLCLNERLLILAAKKALNSKYYNFTNYNNYNKPRYNYYSRPKTTSCRVSLRIPNIFALGSLRLRGRRKSNHYPRSLDFPDYPDSTSTTSDDESFISIKFEENGDISWDKNVSNVSLEHCNTTCPSQTSVKHTVSKGNFGNHNNMLSTAKSLTTPLKWRIGIGRLLKVVRWRRSSKANAGLGKK